MGARRAASSSQQRMQLALAVLAPQRPHGTGTRLAHDVGVARQTIDTVAAMAERGLLTGLVPGPHGPQVTTFTIQLDRHRRLRSSLVLTKVGVSQREVAFCLTDVLDTTVAGGWLPAARTQFEQAAATHHAT